MKKLLTIDDLYNYYTSHNRNAHFSAKDDDSEIVVQVIGNAHFSAKDDTEGLLPVHLQACHTLENANGSFIEEKVMKSAMKSFKNRPILAFIYKDDNGDYQFYSHNMHEEDGEIVYDEIPVGIIPEKNNAELVYDGDKDKTYLEVDGYIFEGYSKAPEILDREGEVKVSVELCIREMSYNAKEKVLVFDDFYFEGVTLLGKDPETGEEIGEGMKGSNCKITDFAKKKNSVFSNKEDMFAMLEQINNKLNDLTNIVNTKNSTEGGNTVDIFNELLEQYGKTVEDVPFSAEDFTDEEELKSKFEELFGEDSQDENPSSDEEPNEEDAKPEAESEDEAEGEEGAEGADESEGSEAEPEAEAEGETKEFSMTGYSVEFSDGSKKTFGLTLTEQLGALSILVNDSYSEMDNTWYYVDADAEKKEVFMHDAWADKHYKQSYKVKNDTFTLVGDRVEVYATYLTADEKKKVEDMKSNYASMSEELDKYKAEEVYASKTELLNSEDYSALRDQKEFSDLVSMITNREDNYSFEELKGCADEMLLNYAKTGKLNFASVEKSEKKDSNSSKHFGTDRKEATKRGKYGKTFVN